MKPMCRKSTKIQFPPSRDLQGAAASPLFLKGRVLHQQYSLISGRQAIYNKGERQNAAAKGSRSFVHIIVRAWLEFGETSDFMRTRTAVGFPLKEDVRLLGQTREK